MKALLVINSKSGAVQTAGVEAIRDEAVRAANEIGGVELDIVAGAYNDLVDAVRRDKAAEAVICAGGDGTQAAIAGALLHSERALLPLPCGTINMLCRDLHIPLDVREALRAGLAAPKVKIDVGRIGGRVFLNNIVFGAYAELAEAREELRDAETVEDVSFGLVEAAGALFHAEPAAFEAIIDGKHEQLATNTIVVSNNAISSSENLIPYRDRLDGGRLYVYLADAQHGGDFAALLAAFAAGGADQSERLTLRICNECRIGAAGDAINYTVDGDPVETDGPVDMEIVSAALTVFSPAAAT